MYSIISCVHHDVREAIPMHMYMTILSRIYTCIHVYIYIDKYIHTQIHILIFQNYFVHAQYRRVQRRSPRHQLYEVLGMTADSCPRYHLNEVVPSGVLPAIICTKCCISPTNIARIMIAVLLPAVEIEPTSQ